MTSLFAGSGCQGSIRCGFLGQITRVSRPKTLWSGSSAAEGKSRHDLGREAFEARVWQWKQESGSTILRQLRRLGGSCDWTRQRFTLDEGLSRAVREVFVCLYAEGLIYRGKRLINWCVRCRTALSDLEVKAEQVQGKLWYIRYRVQGSDDFVTVATTRPDDAWGYGSGYESSG